MAVTALAPASFASTPSAAVRVEIVGAERFASLAREWRDLVRRAALPNVAMDPAVAAASVGAVRAVLAWREAAGGPELAGVWLLRVGRLFARWPVPVLLAPVHRTLILGGPVIDRSRLAETLEAMLAALAADRSLPAILRIGELPTEGPTYAALAEVLARRRRDWTALRRLTRPKLVPGEEGEAYLLGALAGKRRAELRRCRRRLGELGSLEVTTHRAPEEVRAAFEAFLTLEAQGWKGRAGSALAQRGAEAEFARTMVRGLAEQGGVTIMALRLDGRPAALEVMLRCGGVVHTWKSTYDETWRGFGPGFVLMEDLTRALLADPDLVFADMSNDEAFTDPHGVAAFWTGRHEVADLLVELRPGLPFAFRLTALAARLRRAWRKRGFRG